MIEGNFISPLIVKDYQEAMDFYCNVLGFKVIENVPKGENSRWIRIQAPGGKGSDILLSRAANPEQEKAVGNQTGGRVLFFLYTNNFEADYQNLLEHDVEINEGPFNNPYGQVVVFKDLYGNRIDLIESK